MSDEENESSSDEGPMLLITPEEFAAALNKVYSVDEYFEEDEMDQMSPIEHRRYISIRCNYEMMKTMGERLHLIIF